MPTKGSSTAPPGPGRRRYTGCSSTSPPPGYPLPATIWGESILVGVIDFDTAMRGPRVWDLSYLAYRLAAFTDERATTDASVRGHADGYRADAEWVLRHALHLSS